MVEYYLCVCIYHLQIVFTFTGNRDTTCLHTSCIKTQIMTVGDFQTIKYSNSSDLAHVCM